LYQALLAKPERQVIGWIADLSDKFKAKKKRTMPHRVPLKGEFK